jgi:hypothetical protein
VEGSLTDFWEWKEYHQILGPIDFTSNKKIEYKFTFPSKAMEVHIFVYAYTGGATNGLRTYDLWTEEDDGRRYLAKFSLYTYGANAVAYNSDNIWLPVTSNKKLFLQQITGPTGATGGNGGLEVIGYME